MTSANLQRAARVTLTLALAAYGISYARDPGAGRLLDGVDLAIHETGHLVFGAFGEFVQFAGGTIMQLLMPLAFVGYFLRRRDPHAATVALWWVAQNLWNISVYVADARAQELPLVGGGEHDWAYMLGRLGWMHVRVWSTDLFRARRAPRGRRAADRVERGGRALRDTSGRRRGAGVVALRRAGGGTRRARRGLTVAQRPSWYSKGCWTIWLIAHPPTRAGS